MIKLLIVALFLVGCTENKSANVTAKDGVNGKDGQSIVGPKGDAGAKGDKGDTGAKGATGAAGVSVAGPAGSNGKNAVIKQYTATAAQCVNGGIILDTFTDINSNNTYESDIDTNYQRSVLCNQESKCEDKVEGHKSDDDKNDDKDEDKGDY